MFRDFFRAFAELFTQRRSRLEVSGLLLTLAMLPVSELVVTRMFSHLILHGPERFERDPKGVVVDGSIFFVAFALSRAIHHVVRLNRVRVFRRGFDSSGQQRPASEEAWSWAAAFELSTAMVSLIQIAAFCLLFAWFDLGFGLANVAIGGGVLWLIALIYRHQLAHQVAYLTEGGKPGIGERVGRRIRDAEIGAVTASLAMALSLAVVLYRAVEGQVAGADAIVLFIGLRMMYSQVGNLSASAMRFARVKARLTTGRGDGAVVDPDDELDELDDEAENAGELRPATPSPHRTRLVTQMVLAGQRGDLDQVRRVGTRLNSTVTPSDQEQNAQRAAEAFAMLAAGDDRVPLTAMWWARPFPGTVGNWLSPLVLRRVGDRPVLFQTPSAPAIDPHLVTIGSLLGGVGRHAIVAGTGALDADVTVDPRATYVSVRGPLTAVAVRKSGGPRLDGYGDPTVLVSRVIPVEHTGGNGRLVFVRHVTHADVAVTLPDGMDELSPMASRPGDVEGFIRRLTGYDGVVSSDFSVTAICHSYGLPCAPVAFDGYADLGFVFRDYALGVGLGEVGTPTVVDPDLRRVTWGDLLVTRSLDESNLATIERDVQRGIATYLDRVDTA